MLPSGRLAIGQGELEVAVEAYMGVSALGEISRNTDHFGRHWRTAGGGALAEGTQAPIARMNEAGKAEFGHALQDLIDCLGEVVKLGLAMRGEPPGIAGTEPDRGTRCAECVAVRTR